MNLLDPIRLAFECPLRWEKLMGGDRKRFCEACQKHVHNLSAMTRAEARTLMTEARTPICIRIEVDAQGGGVFLPAAPGLAISAGLVAAAIAAPHLLETQTAAVQAAPQVTSPLPVEPPVEPVFELLGEIPFEEEVIKPPQRVRMGKLALPPQIEKMGQIQIIQPMEEAP